jgi:hypothetical protein
LKSPLERREVHLRGLVTDASVRESGNREGTSGITGCGRAGAGDAAHGRAAESAQADFANFQRRIYSLSRADGTLPD